MSDSVESQRKMFRHIRQIEENGGTSLATRPYWPLSNHSGGDNRHPTCGARINILKRYSKEDAEKILGGEGPAQSTPVKTSRAKLRRPSSWESCDDVFVAPGPNMTDSGVSLTPAAGMDTASRRNAVGVATIVDLGAISNLSPNNSFGKRGQNNVKAKAGGKKLNSEYSLSEVWDSEAEEERARGEAVCVTCSR